MVLGATVVGTIEADADGLTVGDAEDGVGLTEADVIDLVMLTDGAADTEGVTVAFVGAAVDGIIVEFDAVVRPIIATKTTKQEIQFI